MKTFVLGAAAFASSALALVPRGDTCCFGLTANGAQSGTVGQLSDGQNRIGGGLPAGSYCISGGGITDGQGRGCILTRMFELYQCHETWLIHDQLPLRSSNATSVPLLPLASPSALEELLPTMVILNSTPAPLVTMANTTSTLPHPTPRQAACQSL